MKKRAKNERQNYETKFYSSNRKAAILGIVRFAVYLYRIYHDGMLQQSDLQRLPSC
jgi:hypothetical protein